MSARRSKSESPLFSNPADHSSMETILYSPAKRLTGSTIPKSTVIASSAFLRAVPGEYIADSSGSSFPTFKIKVVFPPSLVFVMRVLAKSAFYAYMFTVKSSTLSRILKLSADTRL